MKGTYILVMKLKKNLKVKIGSLGLIDFLRGYYCYVGSAVGSTVNLENRIGRHKNLNREKKGRCRWHVDYLLVDPNVSIVQTVIIENEKRMECEISRMLEKSANFSARGFGCSDCKCRSHLHYFNTKENYEMVLEAYTSTLRDVSSPPATSDMRKH